MRESYAIQLVSAKGKKVSYYPFDSAEMAEQVALRNFGEYPHIAITDLYGVRTIKVVR